MNDLLSNTIMEYDDEYFTPFWIPRENEYYVWNLVNPRNGEPRDPDGPHYVVDYLRGKYGCTDEDIKYLWDWYLWNVKSTITGRYD